MSGLPVMASQIVISWVLLNLLVACTLKVDVTDTSTAKVAIYGKTDVRRSFSQSLWIEQHWQVDI